jgi:hypothetical protein
MTGGNMRRFKEHVFTALGFIILVSVFAFAQSQTSHAGNGNSAVTVDNTSANPVPVAIQGTAAVAGGVAITNSPTVQAAQSGAWSVALSGTPNVSISNTPSVSIANVPTVSVAGTTNVAISGTPSVAISGTPAVTISGTTPIQNVDEPGRNGFAQMFDLTTQPGTQGAGTPEFGPPAGKAMAIEVTNFYMNAPPGQSFYGGLVILNTDRTAQGAFNFPLTDAGTFPDLANTPREIFVSNQASRFYLGAGQTAYFTVNRNSTTGEAGGGVSISGYTVTP